MRCVNCGYDNEPGRHICLKCRSTLSSEDNVDPKQKYMPRVRSEESKPTVLDVSSNEAKPTVVYNDSGAPVVATPLKETVVQVPGKVMQGGNPYGVHEEKMQILDELCPQCHRPLSDGFCASCGYDANKNFGYDSKPDSLIHNTHKDKDEIVIPHVKCVKCKKEVPANFTFCPYCGTAIPKSTIDVFSSGMKEDYPIVEEEKEVPRHFSLTPIAGDEQRPQDPRVLELTEGKIILNRDNTSPENRTITSKEQAEVSLSEDKWYLENRSEFGSTFVAATRPIELQPGDIILIGDQRFRFTPIEIEE